MLMTAANGRPATYGVYGVWLCLSLWACQAGQESPRPQEVRSEESADEPRSRSGDNTAPEFKDVRVEIGAEFPVLLDLNTASVEKLLPGPTSVAFIIIVTDDGTPSRDLLVEVLHGRGGRAESQTSGFNNGLWRISLTATPGTDLRLQATDEWGNVASWPHALVIPSLAEVIAGTWETRRFDSTCAPLSAWTATWKDDGSWSAAQPDTSHEQGGRFLVDGEKLEVTGTWSESGDRNPDTAEWRRRGAFYADETFFHEAPLSPLAQTAELMGSWETSFKTWTGEDGDLVLETEATTVLTFGDDDSWSQVTSGTRWNLGLPEPLKIETSGTYEVVLNENYVDNFGDCLVLSEVVPGGYKESVHLVVMRNDRLLLTPKVRNQP